MKKKQICVVLIIAAMVFALAACGEKDDPLAMAKRYYELELKKSGETPLTAQEEAEWERLGHKAAQWSLKVAKEAVNGEINRNSDAFIFEDTLEKLRSGELTLDSPAKPGSPKALAARYLELDPKPESEMTQAEIKEYNQIFETIEEWGTGSEERNEFLEEVYTRQIKIVQNAIDQLTKQGETARADTLAKLLEALEESETYSLPEQSRAVAAAQAALAAAAAKKEAEAAYKSGKTAPESDFEVKLNDAGDGAVITRYTGPGGNVVIPATIQGMPVTEVYMNPQANASLTSVVIPEGVTAVGGFKDCTALRSVTLPDNVKEIGDTAFRGCTSLASITIPDGVTRIDEWAFAECASLASVTIPGSVTEIGELAFAVCKSLTSVTIPDSVTKIRPQVFRGCTSLTSVTLPNGVTYIDDWAFRDCTSLASVTIPDSVTAIGREAFIGCTSLVTVTISPVKRRWEYNLGNGNAPFAKCLKVSLASQAALKAAGYTGEF